MLKILSLVFIGGGIGSMIRFGIIRFISRFVTIALPVATLSVNVIGSFSIGFLLAIPAISNKSYWLHLLITGLCGGFTTFSAFSWENFNLLKQGNVFLFFVYMLSSVLVCLLATWAGYALGKNLYTA